LIDKCIRVNNYDIGEFIEEIPAIFFTNSKGNMEIGNLNKSGEEYSQLTKDEINNLGFDYYLKYMHPETIRKTGPRFLEFYNTADDEKVIGDFQFIKNPKINQYEAFFTVSKPFKENELLLTSCNPISNLKWVCNKIERIVGEELYVRNNFFQFQNLTNRELEILKLIASGDTNSRISEKLFISIETVKQHRKIIKRKTECRNIVELVRFAQAFDLI
jgi:DNA-binding CsgD family transcriptional regulator